MTKEIKLGRMVNIKTSCTDSVICITYNKKTIKLTVSVLQDMVLKNKSKDSFEINDKILQFLGGINNE